jgi:hypothetical protein
VLPEAIDQAEHLIVCAKGGTRIYQPCSIINASDWVSARRPSLRFD